MRIREYNKKYDLEKGITIIFLLEGNLIGIKGLKIFEKRAVGQDRDEEKK